MAKRPDTLWEYGVGVGYTKFEQYPASNEYSELAIPFPTFQYRGEILRADDRDGAKAYLLKEDNWSFEFSGLGYPSTSFRKNDARREMPDIPWMLAFGPQLVVKLGEPEAPPDHLLSNVEFKLGFYQATSTDFQMTRFNGQVTELKISKKLYTENTMTVLSSTMVAGSRDFLGTYYDVAPQYANAQRPAYEAKSGLLSTDFNLYREIYKGRSSFYAGFNWVSYALSNNRQSSLHKTDTNLNLFIGMTYVLGESLKAAVIESETEGFIDQIREHRQGF